MKKLVSILLAGMMLVGTVAGCSASDKPAESAPASAPNSSNAAESADSGQLSGSIVFATNRTDLADTVLADLAKEFTDQHPGTEIEVEGLKDLEQIMMTHMATNEMPDISPVVSAKLSNSDFPTYFLPIDDLGFTKDSVYFYANGLGPDSKLYALCGATYTNCIVYNKSAFKNAGIESTPKTLDELRADCDKLKAAGITPFNISYRDKWPLRGFLSGFYSQMALTGNQNYKNDLVASDKLLTDEPGGSVEMLKLAREFADKGYFESDLVNGNWDNFRRDIAAGKSAMFYDGVWYNTQFIENGGGADNAGAFPFPGVKALTLTPDWFYAVAKNTENPDLAKAFLKFLIEDGRYAKSMDLAGSIKGGTCEIPGYEELMKLGEGLPVLESPVVDSKFQEILNKAQIDLDSITQEYLIAEDPDSVITKYNEKWTQAKKALGY